MLANSPESGHNSQPLHPASEFCAADARVPFASAYRSLAEGVIGKTVEAFSLLGIAVSEAGRECLLGDLARTINEVALPTIFTRFEAQSSTPFGRFASIRDRDAYSRFVDNVDWKEIAPAGGALDETVGLLLTDWEAYLREVASRFGAERCALTMVNRLCESIDGFERRDADRHGGGRSSATLRFVAEPVVYKSRLVENDLGLATILDGLVGEVRVPDTWSFRGHGWQRFEEIGESVDADAIARHFYRCGWALALSWLCSATDCHATNAISSDNALYLIDCETWFAGRPSHLGPTLPTDDDLSDFFAEELATIGFTPIFGGDPANPILLNQPVLCDGRTYSGVGEVLIWKELGSSSIHPVLDRNVRSEGLTLRHIGNGVAQPNTFGVDIVAGFVEGLGRALETSHRCAIIEAGSSSLQSRIIVRDTTVYDSLLSFGANPEIVGDSQLSEPRSARCCGERSEMPKPQDCGPTSATS
jgi:hypothetical protein